MSWIKKLDKEIGDLANGIRARKPKRLPVVMTREEVKAVLKYLKGDKWLMAMIMYGGGLRLIECLRLRAQDIDFERKKIMVCDDPVTIFGPFRNYSVTRMSAPQ